MQTKEQTDLQIKKLHRLLDKVREHKLGLDWQSKIEFDVMEEKIIEKIKFLQSNVNNTDMVN